VSAEARYQKDEITKGQIIAAQLGLQPAVQEWTDTLPRVIVQWQPTESTNLYASWSKGALPGDINAEYAFGPDNMRTAEQLASAREQIRNGAAPYPGLPGVENGSLGVSTASDFVDREELESYEIGWKQQWLDGRLQMNAAAYFMKWKNQKGRVSVTIVDFNGNTTAPYVKDAATCTVRDPAASQTCNDFTRSLQITVPGTSELQGIELEANWAATNRLTLQAALDYTSNEYTDFTFNFVEPLAGTRDMRGNSSPRYPEWKGNLAANYIAPIGSGDWEWFTRGDLIYFGEYFIDESNLATAPDQTLLNARIGVTNGKARFELFGNNLLDEDAYASASRWTDFTTPAVASTANQGVAVAPQRPRYFGVKFTYEF
jgi:outer membrane receptor protein involved in Fe transport